MLPSGEISSQLPEHHPIKFKKRRLQGACDICKRKKVRCDSANMPGNRCSNCVAFDSECTHSGVSVTRKSSHKKPSSQPASEYEDLLAKEMHSSESALSLVADILSKDKPYRLPTESGAAHQLLTELAIYARSLEQKNTALRCAISQDQKTELSLMAMPTFPDSSTSAVSAEVLDNLSDHMKRSLTVESAHKRFYGPSSNIMLVKTALTFKEKTSEVEDSFESDLGRYRRPEFWIPHFWEIPPVDPIPVYHFPEHDLLLHLVDLYFANINAYFPFLHRPTLDKDLATGLHLRNHFFGATVLAICAASSRYSTDPRVILEGTSSQYSCGWKWFQQIRLIRTSFREIPSLYELQTCIIAMLFLQGTSTPEACWTILSLGIAYAQELGVHRRKPSNQNEPTVEEELTKRVFWTLACSDSFVSGVLGRPRLMNSADFDIDMPIECDDEYWEHLDPTMSFKQPPGKPSRITFFNVYLKLFDIWSFAQRTLYAARKPQLGQELVGEKWEQQVVSTLDSALNKWVDSVPEHLRWDPHRLNPLFFNQSALLYASYYYVQIQVHRNFLPVGGRRSPLAFPSLSICSNAARACSHVMDIQSRRGFLPLPHIQTAAFTAGLVLLLTVWGGQKQGLALDPTKSIADVYKIINLLQTYESRWMAAGRFGDILRELTCAGGLPPPTSQPSTKRNRDSEDCAISNHPDSASHDTMNSSLFPNKEQSLLSNSPALGQLSEHSNHIFQLPFNSSELGQSSFMTSAGVSDSRRLDLHHGNVGIGHPFHDIRTFPIVELGNSLNRNIHYSHEGPHESLAPSGPWTGARLPDDDKRPVCIQSLESDIKTRPGDIHDGDHGILLDSLHSSNTDETGLWRTTLPTGYNNSNDWDAFIADVEGFMQNNYIPHTFSE